jgi:hypothetical protein
VRTAASLTACLLQHYASLKLENIVDEEKTITHEQFAAQIETRLGSGDGDKAKGPDTRVWDKDRSLKDVRAPSFISKL